MTTFKKAQVVIGDKPVRAMILGTGEVLSYAMCDRCDALHLTVSSPRGTVQLALAEDATIELLIEFLIVLVGAELAAERTMAESIAAAKARREAH